MIQVDREEIAPKFTRDDVLDLLMRDVANVAGESYLPQRERRQMKHMMAEATEKQHGGSTSAEDPVV